MKRLIKKKTICIFLTAVVLCFASVSVGYAAEQDVSMQYSDNTLTINGLSGEADLIHASYTDGVMESAEIIHVTNGTQAINTAEGDKFFLWDDVNTMEPLCAPITVGKSPRNLVVYYSATGRTERIANYIASATNSDVFVLEPADPYTSADLNWTDENSRVVYEHDHPDERDVELVTTTVPDWESYDTVFIGYPIWWGIAAWPVNGFVEANDFSGKTVIPFCTSSSSGLGESGQLLEEMAGTGTWLEGQRFSSGVTEEDVQAWIESLNL